MNADPICGMTVNDRKQQQTMKSDPPETEKDLGKDLKTFGQLPAKSKELFLRTLQETAERPLHAKAYYGLARVALLEKDPETGDRLFRNVLEFDPDGSTKAWTLLYLGKLADSQGDDGGWDAGLGPGTSTALGLLSIALNYRYLPIYER